MFSVGKTLGKYFENLLFILTLLEKLKSKGGILSAVNMHISPFYSKTFLSHWNAFLAGTQEHRKFQRSCE